MDIFLLLFPPLPPKKQGHANGQRYTTTVVNDTHCRHCWRYQWYESDLRSEILQSASTSKCKSRSATVSGKQIINDIPIDCAWVNVCVFSCFFSNRAWYLYHLFFIFHKAFWSWIILILVSSYFEALIYMDVINSGFHSIFVWKFAAGLAEVKSIDSTILVRLILVTAFSIKSHTFYSKSIVSLHICHEFLKTRKYICE